MPYYRTARTGGGFPAARCARGDRAAHL